MPWSPPLRSRSILLAACGLVVLAPVASAQAVLKVACLGASTVSGFGSSNGHHFPDELARVLGSGFQVRNFGVSGTTILKKGDSPYWNTGQLGQALAFRPDIAVFWFGGNDTKPQNWTHKAEFVPDYESMLKMFQALPAPPRLFLFQSIILKDGYGISRRAVDTEVLPLTDTIAADTHATVLNDHDTFINHPELFNSDGIHPNDMGNAAIAKHVAGYITRALEAADGGADAADAAADAVTGGDAPGSDGGMVMVDSSRPPVVDAPPAGTGGAAGSGVAGTGGAGGAPASPGTGGGSVGGGGNMAAASSGGGGCSVAGASLKEPAAVGFPTGVLLGLVVGWRRRRQRKN